MRVCVRVMLAAGLLSAAAFGQAIEFDFKDPKGVNAMTFTADSMLEPISGVASGVSGKLTFDPADPRTLRGTLVVEAEGVKCSNARMTEVLHGKDWLAVEEHPTIEFKITGVNSARNEGEHRHELEVAGEFTMRGVTKAMVLKVRATYLPGKLGERMGGRAGDLLVLRTDFQVPRKDFNVDAARGSALVADNIELRAAIVGVAPRSE